MLNENEIKLQRKKTRASIDIKALVANRKSCRADGTLLKYDAAVEKAKAYFTESGYSLDIITDHHPLLLADYYDKCK